MALRLYNTLTRQKEEVKPLEEGRIKIYSCGPTVYYPMHIGNIRAYANWDILHRALLFLGYEVDRYINITDVGHMTNDEDHGEDKIEESAKKQSKDPLEIADYYIRTVLNDFARLNYLHPDGSKVDPDMELSELKKHHWLRATAHVQEMIDMVKEIEKNGYTYETDQALYYDVTKFGDYTKLSGQRLEDKLVAVRDDVDVDPDKKHPADFVLWMKRVGKYENHIQHWNSPWGDGFPGWHIECSAMGCDALGDRFDIHTGGVDHISVHHSNEIAQNFGAFQHQVVNMWLHNEFLTAKDGGKLSKSKGNSWELDDLIAEGYDPLDLRYYFISIHYRQPIALSREGLDGAKASRRKLISRIEALGSEAGVVSEEYLGKFTAALEDDLNMSQSLAVVNELLSSDVVDSDKVATIKKFDEVLALDLVGNGEFVVPGAVEELVEQRRLARESKDYAKSDELRDKIDELGYIVKDTSEGQVLTKK